ncbi:MAG: DUF177 domain-containing protein [Oscillospiraceae bacterium]|nr:DUF177 domain-containing protein [Oscillospiraceae bacterium]MBQ4544449.1 DUF177 domain-containing protein [Oscillospiraceae bacterium]MBQ6902633.1 DUF177 domain-containing protein [Oscillospiraceae bacterium]
MCINIKQLRDGSLREKQFEFTVDISDVEPTVSSPVTVSGEIVNRADVLLLSMTVEGMRDLICDRCAKEFSRKTSVRFESCIVDHLDNEEDEDDFIVCEGDELELSELAVSMFILGFDSKNLCTEDCKGLCQVCGANLNEQACNCKVESIDPRLEILAQLLDD